MEDFINNIDALDAIHPIIPAAIKLGLIVVISLFALIPLSLVSWILAAAFSKSIERLRKGSENSANYFFYLAKKITSRRNRIFKKFYKQHSNYISFDKPSYRIDGHPAQQAIDNFSKTLNEAPTMISDREKEKADIVKGLTASLEGLGNSVKTFEELSVPNLELDMEHTMKKRRAFSTLFIFLPILAAVMIFNTNFLNTFFYEIWEDDTVPFIGLPIALIIAGAFTVFEVAVGVVFGFIEKQEEGKEASASKNITYVFGWFVIFSLAVVELFLYLGLAGFEEIADFGFADGIMAILNDPDRGFLYIILGGGYFALLGPAVVFVLYILGHEVSRALFDFSKLTDYERFKRDLDKGDKTVDKMILQAEGHFKNIEGLVSRLKTENTSLNQGGDRPEKALKQFSDKIAKDVKSLEENLTKTLSFEIPAPKIQTEKLNQADAESFYRTNILYFIMLVASLFILIAVFPKFVSVSGQDFSFYGFFPQFLAIVATGLAVVSGSLTISQVDVVQADEKGIARLNVEKSSILFYVLAIIIFGITMVAEYYIIQPSFKDLSILNFLLCILCYLVGYLNGRKIYTAVSSWFLSVQSVWSTFLGFLSIATGSVLKMFEVLVTFIDPLLWGIAFPCRYFFVKKEDLLNENAS